MKNCYLEITTEEFSAVDLCDEMSKLRDSSTPYEQYWIRDDETNAVVGQLLWMPTIGRWGIVQNADAEWGDDKSAEGALAQYGLAD